MNLWWKCPNCGNKIDFIKEMSEVFDGDDGEAEFDPDKGLCFHSIMCNCGAVWVVSISEMDVME